MGERERLLAEIEAKRRQQAEKPIRILSANLRLEADDVGYDPYDNPGPAKPDGLQRRLAAGTQRPRKRRR